MVDTTPLKKYMLNMTAKADEKRYITNVLINSQITKNDQKVILDAANSSANEILTFEDIELDIENYLKDNPKVITKNCWNNQHTYIGEVNSKDEPHGYGEYYLYTLLRVKGFFECGKLIKGIKFYPFHFKRFVGRFTEFNQTMIGRMYKYINQTETLVEQGVFRDIEDPRLQSGEMLLNVAHERWWYKGDFFHYDTYTVFYGKVFNTNKTKKIAEGRFNNGIIEKGEIFIFDELSIGEFESGILKQGEVWEATEMKDGYKKTNLKQQVIPNTKK